MDCPRCNAEMTPLEGEDVSLQRCSDCNGVWLAAADLNRILVHNNLPVLNRFGGKSNLEEIAGTCPECSVDLTVIEGGSGHNHDLLYESCESCGGIWLELEDDVAEADLPEVEKAVVAYFRRFKSV